MTRILLALVCPDSGMAYWEDVIGNLHRLRPSSRRLFAYASCGNTLMSGTIRENIVCGRPDATDAEIGQAAGDAEIEAFIEGLDKKYESQIGANGLNLSESQFQQIAIARALVARAPVLILDEATSAIDAAAETRILANIMQRQPKLICILATHRIAACSNHDISFHKENCRIG